MLRHSGVKEAEVQLAYGQREVCLRVRDAGRVRSASSAMTGRPEAEPRTARFFMAGPCFGIGGSLAVCYK